jgi:hypothetical protein
MCPNHLYPFIHYGETATKEEYIANMVVCFMFTCLHEIILEMFVCNCDKVRKDAE